MASHRRSPLPLLAVLSLAALAAVAWLVLELGGSPEGPGDTGVVDAPEPVEGPTPLVAPAPAGVDRLPPAQPARVEIQPPPRLGPAKIVVRVRDGDTGRPVPTFQLNVLEAAEGDPLERLGEAVRQPIRRRDGIIGVEQEPGLYDVVVIAPGYQPAVLRGVEVPALDGRPLPVTLERGPGIAGTVYDRDGLRQGGVPVYLGVTRLRDPQASPPTLRRVTTALDGSFGFSPLPAGEYTLALLEPDNQDDRMAGIRVVDGTTRVELILGSRHRLTVQVEDHEGRPLSGVRLELRSADHFASAETNSAGVALLEHLPDGQYELVARHPRYEDQQEPVELVGGLGDHLQHLRLVVPRPG